MDEIAPEAVVLGGGFQFMIVQDPDPEKAQHYSPDITESEMRSAQWYFSTRLAVGLFGIVLSISAVMPISRFAVGGGGLLGDVCFVLVIYVALFHSKPSLAFAINRIKWLPPRLIFYLALVSSLFFALGSHDMVDWTTAAIFVAVFGVLCFLVHVAGSAFGVLDPVIGALVIKFVNQHKSGKT